MEIGVEMAISGRIMVNLAKGLSDPSALGDVAASEKWCRTPPNGAGRPSAHMGPFEESAVGHQTSLRLGR